MSYKIFLWGFFISAIAFYIINIAGNTEKALEKKAKARQWEVQMLLDRGTR
jgi:hypothetical protein